MPKSTATENNDVTGPAGHAHDHASVAIEGTEKDAHRPLTPPDTGLHARRQDPIFRMTAVMCAGVIFLMAIVTVASFSNRANYYLIAANGAVEIWQGRFAPKGRERVLVLPGALPPLAVKEVYGKTEINAIVFNYYIDRADMLLEAPDMPDFNGIKLYLKTAMSYGLTDAMRQAALSRLNHIDMMTYLYKADVAASKGTLADFKKALAYMGQAAALDLDAAQSDLVDKKIQSINELMADLRNKNSASPSGPAGAPAVRQGVQPESESPAE